MSKPIPFNSIDGDIKFELEVVDGTKIVLVDVSVSTSQFRKFWRSQTASAGTKRMPSSFLDTSLLTCKTPPR